MARQIGQSAVERGGGPPILPIVAGILVVAVLAGVGYWWVAGDRAGLGEVLGDLKQEILGDQRSDPQVPEPETAEAPAVPETPAIETPAIETPAIETPENDTLPPEPPAPETAAAETAPELPPVPEPEPATDAAAVAPQEPEPAVSPQPAEESVSSQATAAPVEADPALDFESLMAAAARGDAEAQYRVARAYRDAVGVKGNPIEATAWFMQAAARDHEAAIVERDQALAQLDDSGRTQAASLARRLGPPLPAGWVRDPQRNIAVWSPSWYRDGTVSMSIEVPAVDGLAEGDGKVVIDASLPGRSDRTVEGRFSKGLMLDPALEGSEFQLLEIDVVRRVLRADAALAPAVKQVWMDIPLDALKIPACPQNTVELIAVMADSFTGVVDEEVESAAVAAAKTALATCEIKSNAVAKVQVVPATHETTYDKGNVEYQPVLAFVQVYGFDRASDDWSVSVRNFARQAQEQRDREAERQRKKDEKAKKKAQQIAAALARPMPDIRGLKLGMSLADLRATLGDQAIAWQPPWDPQREMPAFRPFKQEITLEDQATLLATFTSTQNRSVLMTLVYEQQLRDGPTADELRKRLYDKYGEPDDVAGQDSWLTWWLKSSVKQEPKGAFMKGRIESDRSTGRVSYMRLLLNDYRLGLLDEAEGLAARRKAEREAREKTKSDEVKF